MICGSARMRLKRAAILSPATPPPTITILALASFKGMRDTIRAILNHSATSANKSSGSESTGRKRTDDQEVKGFMTLNEIALETGVPKDWLIKKLNLPADTAARQPVREWMHAQGKSIQDLGDAVAEFRAHRN